MYRHLYNQFRNYYCYESSYQLLIMKKGFSLIEVLVFVTVLSLVFVAAMAVVTYSLKTMKINEHKILASHYAEEAMEWVKGQKEDNWVEFTAHDAAAGTAIYCINGLDFIDAAECGEFYALGSPAIFKRELLLENVPDSATPDRVDATVNVYWLEGGKDYNVSVSTVLKRLE